jgi:hypothetical protein
VHFGDDDEYWQGRAERQYIIKLETCWLGSDLVSMYEMLVACLDPAGSGTVEVRLKICWHVADIMNIPG